MKFTLIIDKNREEEVVIYAKEKNDLVLKIRELISSESDDLIGYKGNELIRVLPKDVFCFTIEGGKLFAIMENERIQLKQRLYQIEELVGQDFVKINQSSIANIKKIDRFKATLGGSLVVTFKNGYRDYVSRRQVRTVKERIGVK